LPVNVCKAQRFCGTNKKGRSCELRPFFKESERYPTAAMPVTREIRAHHTLQTLCRPGTAGTWETKKFCVIIPQL
jgi:hypothetical protein